MFWINSRKTRIIRPSQPTGGVQLIAGIKLNSWAFVGGIRRETTVCLMKLKYLKSNENKFTSVYITMCERTVKAAFLDVQHIWVLSVQTHLGVERLIASACPSSRCCRTSARGGRSERLHVCSQPDVLIGSSVAQIFTWTQISFFIRFWWKISRKEKL